ncbi:MAG TPA: hypothetical protein VGF22_19980 [Acidimicrobiales bacterium]|jgi:nucleoside phosphorylase
MIADASWLKRNLGLTVEPAPAGAAAGTVEAVDDTAVAREIIDFDSESPVGKAFAAQAPLTTTLSQFVPLDWPAGLAPVPGPKPTGPSLPPADVLVVTWTVDEGHALSKVLTPGHDSHDDWPPYTKNFDTIAKDMRPLSPARQLGRLGTFWTATIGSHSVTLFKSDSHMSQDGPDLANATVWRQIIADCQPKLVITTGTGGGIGADFEVGDVIVSRFVTFDCQRQFASLNGQSYASPRRALGEKYDTARRLFGANVKFLPADNTRPPRIVTSRAAAKGILTTDFFGFDNTANTYGLQGKGDLSEMGDAVLGKVCREIGPTAPSYVAVRNVSDPQISSTGLTLAQQTAVAADIYKGYGRWSTVCSAIVCWAIIAGT